MPLVPGGLGQASKFAPANPAAGADIDYTVPLAARYYILSVNFTFTTDANIANRYVSASFEVGTDKFISIPAHDFFPPNSTAYKYSLFSGGSSFHDAHNDIIHLPLSPHVHMSGQFTFKTLTANIQVGDQFSNITIWVSRWLEPQ